MLQPINSLNVQLNHEFGNALSGKQVKLLKHTLTSSEEIASGRTDEKGEYAFTIPADTKGVSVVVVDEDGTEVEKSQVLFKSDFENTLQLTTDYEKFRPAPMFEQQSGILNEHFEALTKAGKTLGMPELRFLTETTKQHPVDIWRWMKAAELAQKTGASAEGFYGLFSMGLPADESRLALENSAGFQGLLEGAATAGFIAARTPGEIDSFIESWDQSALKKEIINRVPEISADAKKLFDAAGIPDGQHAGIFAKLSQSQQNAPDPAPGGFSLTGDDSVDEKLERAMRLSIVTGGQAALTKTLLDIDFGDKDKVNGASIRELAAIDDAALEKKVEAAAANDTEFGALLAGANGEPDKEKIKDYSAALRRRLRQAFPTGHFFGSLDTLPDGDRSGFGSLKSELLDFEKNHPSFNLKETPLYQTKDESLFKDLAAPEVLRQELMAAQRLATYTDDFRLMNALRTDGLDTSRAIVQLSEQTFVAKYGSEPGLEDTARVAYRNAGAGYLATLALYTAWHPGANQTTTALPGSAAVDTPAAKVEPTLRTLFGSQDMCACSECSSVLSPAAYLTDILKYLEDNAPECYAELLRRRPDLAHIDLNCANTNTPLPYVDLVNELLERVATGTLPLYDEKDKVKAEWYQTTWTAPELEANPEHLKYEAYKQCATAVYPLPLPFNLPLAETRIYLKHLRTGRLQLMELAAGDSAEDVFNDEQIAAERLGLSPEEAAIISGKTVIGGMEHEAWAFYGFDKEEKFTTVKDPLDPAKPVEAGSWVEALSGRADVFLAQSGLSYTELWMLLRCRWINPDGKITIGAAPADTCELHQMNLSGADADAFSRIHRFVRLWRRLGWQMYELDQVLQAYPPDHLAGIAGIDWLRRSTGLPVGLLTGLFNDREWQAAADQTPYKMLQGDEVIGMPSLFDQLFRNKADEVVTDSADKTKDENVFPRPGGFIPDDTWDKHKSRLLAAFRLTAQEYELLQGKEGLAGTGQLTYDGLAALYRHSMLTRMAGFDIAQYLQFLDLLQANDMPSEPAKVIRFLEQVEFLRHSGFSLAELDYLLLKDDAAKAPAPSETEIGSFLLDVRLALRAGESAVAETIDAYLPAAEKKDPDNGNGTDGNKTADEITAEIAAAGKEKAVKRWQAIVAARRKIMIQKFAEKLAVSAAAAETLLNSILPAPSGPGDAAATDTLGLLLWSEDITKSDFLKKYPDLEVSETQPQFADTGKTQEADAKGGIVPVPELFNAYRRMDKAATFIRRLQLSDDETRILTEHAADLECTDLTALPAEKPGETFLHVENLINLVRARDLLPKGNPGLFAILEETIKSADGKSAWIAGLCRLSGRNPDTVEKLAGAAKADHGLLHVADDKQLLRGSLILRIINVLKTLKQAGLDVSDLEKITAPDNTSLQQAAIAVKKAARAKYDARQWYGIARPLRDELREQQRAALMAYVIARPGAAQQWRDSNDLYACLLIDVEMKPAAMTSRIKQAISGVQLFIDRVLLSLEYPGGDSTKPALVMRPEHVAQWEQWRKLYRIWEANRRIFLYPENWIEPELRDDKTPFFKELESQLAQAELSDENTETAFSAYLEKLDTVARLDIVGFYRQSEPATAEDPAADILHVIGRTYGQPHQYFHRMQQQNEWTPWTKIEVDIDGDHVLPVVFNRRLCLFWLFFVEETQEADGPMSATTVSDKYRNWRIQIAWSEYKRNKWTAKRLSKSFYTTAAVSLDNGGTLFVNNTQVGKASKNTVLQEHKDKMWLTHQFSPAQDLILMPHYSGTGLSGDLVFGCFKFTGTNSDPEFIPNSLTGTDQMFNQGRKLIGLSPMRLERQVIRRGSPSIFRIKWENPLRFEVLINGDDIQIYKEKDGFKITTLLEKNTSIDQTLLEQVSGGSFNLIVPMGDNILPLETEFFFQDARNTFYVTHDTVDIGLYLEKYPRGEWKRWAEVPKSDPNVPNPGGINPFGPVVDPPPDFRMRPFSNFISHATLATTAIGQASVGNEAGYHPAEQAAKTLAFMPPALKGIDFRNWPFSPLPPLPDLPKEDGRKVTVAEDRFRFETFQHLQVKEFVRRLNKFGIRGLLKRELQQLPDNLSFELDYAPKSVAQPFPNGRIDFSFGSAYSQYNWELFFHAPMLIACRLSADQRFEEARKWFHYIFNPTAGEGGGKERFWQFQPFYQEAQKERTETLTELLSSQEELMPQLEKWMANPFRPHVIARMRVVAYMKNVVMKYIDNLIGWGDQLFRRETIEAINEATNLYVLCAQILGPRPQHIPPRATHEDQDFFSLNNGLDAFSNAWATIESYLAPAAGAAVHLPSGDVAALAGLLSFGIRRAGAQPDGEAAPPGKMLYFGIPGNENLLQYWDTVADRLFKIRHSMNIDGLQRTLPLFEPPIDPALLVRAAAAGVDLNTLLSDVYKPLPKYRFQYMLQKAGELCNDLKTLGNELLSVLEKKDAEQLALLRSTHELQMLRAIRSQKDKQLEEAKALLEAARQSLEAATLRQQYYSSRKFMNAYETGHLASMQAGLILSLLQEGATQTRVVLAAIPNIKIGSPTSAGATYGGDNLQAMAESASNAAGILAHINNTVGSTLATLGGYERRMDDWKFQSRTAEKEMGQLERQVIAAEIRVALAEKEVDNHQLQMDNATEADDFMRGRFTNRQLYEWMAGQISTVYFQSYQLAYDLAKQAQQCYEHELGEYGKASFIQFGYWDSLKKGLTSADRLQLDLRRMESAYLAGSGRAPELTKHISLMMLDPGAILDLRTKGICTVMLPEALFDLDYPGHYFRRIKSVSLSIPCVAGPFTTVSCTLTLKQHAVRIDPDSGTYATEDYTKSRYFRYSNAPQSIATSNAQNDSGVFELNFHDERYLPFEGSGVISEWELAMQQVTELRAFDYNTISDVVMHLRYTAKEGSPEFKETSLTALKQLFGIGGDEKEVEKEKGTGLRYSTESWRMFSLRHEFGTEWQQMMSVGDNSKREMTFKIERKHLPFFARNRDIKINSGQLTRIYGGQQYAEAEFPVSPAGGAVIAGKYTLSIDTDTIPVKCSVSMSESAMAAEMDDLILVLQYCLVGGV